MGVYATAGLFYAIAGLLLVARTGVGDPNAGGARPDNLDSITAVVLGGTSLFGGRGLIVGHADRRADRRRVPEWPPADGRRVELPGAHHRHPRDRRGVRRLSSRTAASSESGGSRDEWLHLQPGNVLLEMRDIGKTLPRRQGAGRRPASPSREGQVHALLGENGAGKSTLIKILSGAYTKDEGQILFDGQPVEIRGPHDAQALGISTIYQEFNLARDLTVAENIFLGHLPTKGVTVDWATVKARIARDPRHAWASSSPSMPRSRRCPSPSSSWSRSPRR